MANEHQEAHFGIQSVGHVPAVAAIDCMVLYDPQDGRIVHMHHVIAFEGARRRDHDELQSSARESAKRFGCQMDGLKVLHVPNFHPAAGKVCRVDPKKRKLVEVQVPDDKGRHLGRKRR